MRAAGTRSGRAATVASRIGWHPPPPTEELPIPRTAPPPVSRARVGLLAAALAAALTGCSLFGTGADDTGAADASERGTDPVAPGAGGDEPTAGPGDGDGADLGDGDDATGDDDGGDAGAGEVRTAPCAPLDADEMVEAVAGQLEAITDRRLEDALAYATASFRDGIDAEHFEEIIVGSFPLVARAEGFSTGVCRLVGGTDAAVLEVTVADVDGAEQELAYLFERGVDGWGIGGAVPADESDAGDASITA